MLISIKTITSCESNLTGKPGCDIVDDGEVSFGATFNDKKGGVYAMKWDADTISVCESNTLVIDLLVRIV